jgi:hypothetical protein
LKTTGLKGFCNTSKGEYRSNISETLEYKKSLESKVQINSSRYFHFPRRQEKRQTENQGMEEGSLDDTSYLGQEGTEGLQYGVHTFTEL